MSLRVAAVVLVAMAAIGCGGAKLPAPSPEPSPAALVLPPPAPKSAVDELRAAIDSMVADSRFRSAIWGILIVNPDANDTLYALNAGKLFLPASNMKIVTGSAALVELGPDYQYPQFASGNASPPCTTCPVMRRIPCAATESAAARSGIVASCSM